MLEMSARLELFDRSLDCIGKQSRNNLTVPRTSYNFKIKWREFINYRQKHDATLAAFIVYIDLIQE